MTTIWFPREPAGAFGAALAERWPAGWELRAGEVPGDGARILVSGVPEETWLRQAPELRHVVIPWAGLPPRTRELLRAWPELSVHNLHHNAAPTAEHALALLLALAKRLLSVDAALRRGDWRPRWEGHGAVLLEGRRALVLGRGAIGGRLGRALEALGCVVTRLGRRDLPEPRGGDSLRLAVSELLPEHELVLVALPWTEETDGLFDSEMFGHVRTGTLLVNIARGSICEESALLDALARGPLAGAGLDVWWRYPQSEAEREDLPPAEGGAFEELPNVVLTPHLAGHCDRTEELRADALVTLLAALCEGRDPGNRVDLERGY